ncbi:MAG: addiction module protein [candidate division NC10 bacterium]|nr:addiction module protein [candidate division NC10 bacterium]
MWIQEAESRYAAYRREALTGRPAEEVFGQRFTNQSPAI